jgi:hypothetical protein
MNKDSFIYLFISGLDAFYFFFMSNILTRTCLYNLYFSVVKAGALTLSLTLGERLLSFSVRYDVSCVSFKISAF